MNVYVGNLSWSATEEDLTELFSHFGDIKSTIIIKDRNSGRSKGFGFVEFESEEQAKIAIDKLNNTVFMERTLIVNEARPKKD
ncbi:MAG: RNA-binding protein [Balneolales bacterium]|nr:RNA-binding protein [Balneolales bacterium]